MADDLLVVVVELLWPLEGWWDFFDKREVVSDTEDSIVWSLRSLEYFDEDELLCTMTSWFKRKDDEDAVEDVEWVDEDVEGPDADPVEEVVDFLDELVEEATDPVVEPLFPARLTVKPLKQRDSSAAALLVKLTSADIPVPKRLLTLLQAVLKTINKQARVTHGDTLFDSLVFRCPDLTLYLWGHEECNLHVLFVLTVLRETEWSWK